MIVRFALPLVLLAFIIVGCGVKEEKKQAYQKKEFQHQRTDAAHAQLKQGVIQLNQGQVEQAIKSFQIAIAADPTKPDAFLILAETYIRLKQFDQAIPVLGKAAELFPENGTIFYMLAVANRGAGQLSTAVLAVRRSIELFEQAKDEESLKRSITLLSQFVSQAKAIEKAAY